MFYTWEYKEFQQYKMLTLTFLIWYFPTSFSICINCSSNQSWSTPIRIGFQFQNNAIRYVHIICNDIGSSSNSWSYENFIKVLENYNSALFFLNALRRLFHIAVVLHILCSTGHSIQPELILLHAIFPHPRQYENFWWKRSSLLVMRAPWHIKNHLNHST